MTITAIVGANWGDEGKGKLTDVLAVHSQFVVRYQGGSNAGHTIINDYGKFALHMLPSGVFYPGTTNVIGPGVALNMGKLQSEFQELVKRGGDENMPVSPERYKVSWSLKKDALQQQLHSHKYKGLSFYDVLETYEKLGIPLQEQKMLAGVAVDAVFDSVSVATTFKGKLADAGVIFCPFSEAVKEHPELVKKYLGSVVPAADNFFSALNSAVFTDGSFVTFQKAYVALWNYQPTLESMLRTPVNLNAH